MTIDFQSCRLGESAPLPALESSADHCAAALALATQATRSMRIFSHQLDRRVYHQKLFIEALTRLELLPALLSFALVLCVGNVSAMGNYPEANTCSQDKPYYAVCTAGSHNLQGWVGKCQANREDAQREADAHAQKSHVGVMQWTGVTRINHAAKYRNSGLPP